MEISLEERINRITNRFEIAVSNFGRSCIDMQANEKAFQAWYAASIIQEFGLAHVYREIHLKKAELFRLSPPNDMTRSLEKGNELFPDVSISWFPNVDARSSNTRDPKLENPGAFFTQFAILSELKVTGSTQRPTPKSMVVMDIAKLSVFSEAHHAYSRNSGAELPLRCYMVILDNAKDNAGRFKNTYTKDKIDRIVKNALGGWKEEVLKPCIVLIIPSAHAARVSLLRDFNEWIDLH